MYFPPDPEQNFSFGRFALKLDPTNLAMGECVSLFNSICKIVDFTGAAIYHLSASAALCENVLPI
jgi:hypothetical protein